MEPELRKQMGGFALLTNHNRAGELNLPSNLPIYPRPDTVFPTVLHSSHCVAGEIKRRVYFLRRRRGRSAERGRRPGTGAILSPCGDRGPGTGTGSQRTAARARLCRWLLWLALAGPKEPGRQLGEAEAQAGTAQGAGPGPAARLPGAGWRGRRARAAPQWRRRARPSWCEQELLSIKLMPSTEDNK